MLDVSNGVADQSINISLFDQESKIILDRSRKLGIDKAARGRQYTIVDLFSGSGGLSFGFHLLQERLDAYRLQSAVDFDPHANSTYAENFGTKPLALDLMNLGVEDVLESVGVEPGKDNLIVMGGPPCVAFSSHKKKDKRFDARGSLVEKFAMIATALSPELIIMENVPDLMGKRHWGHFEIFRNQLLDSGYKVNLEIVNMAAFGVPQSRHRLICIAAKNQLPSLPSGHLQSGEFRTVRDAISHLPPLKAGERNQSDSMHQTSSHRESTIDVIKQVPADGGSRPFGVGPKCLDEVKGFSDVYGRLYWDRPSVTLTARCRTPSCGRYVHPEQHRGLSVREAALIQSYPPEFQFNGPFDDKFKQIGNSVAPLFSLSLAVHVLGILTGLVKEEAVSSGPSDGPLFGSYSGRIANRNLSQSSRSKN